MKIAFVGGLSDKLLEKVMMPFQAMDEVEEIGLFRRTPFNGEKITWKHVPPFIGKISVAGEFWKFLLLLFYGNRYDVIIGCFQQYHGLWAWIAGRLLRKPVIQYVITDVEWNLERLVPRLAMMNSDACAVMGPISKEKLLKASYRNAVEPVKLPISIPEIDYVKIEKKYDFLAIGMFCGEKDYPWMMEVLELVKKSRPDFKMAIRASGDNGNLFKMIRSKKLDGNIKLLGYLTENELTELYFSSRIFLLTSKVEGLATVVLEAMAHSLPVVVTSVGELPWLVRDGTDGKLLEHGDTEKMAEALLELLPDEKRLAEMGGNAKERIKELIGLFQAEAIAENWKKLIKSAMEKNKRL